MPRRHGFTSNRPGLIDASKGRRPVRQRSHQHRERNPSRRTGDTARRSGRSLRVGSTSPLWWIPSLAERLPRGVGRADASAPGAITGAPPDSFVTLGRIRRPSRLKDTPGRAAGARRIGSRARPSYVRARRARTLTRPASDLPAGAVRLLRQARITGTRVTGLSPAPRRLSPRVRRFRLATGASHPAFGRRDSAPGLVPFAGTQPHPASPTISVGEPCLNQRDDLAVPDSSPPRGSRHRNRARRGVFRSVRGSGRTTACSAPRLGSVEGNSDSPVRVSNREATS